MQKSMQSAELPSILMLSSAETEHTRSINDAFVRKLNAKLSGVCSVIWRNYQNVGIRMGAGGLDAFLVSDGQSLSDFRLVYFKSYFRYHEEATAIVEYLEDRQVSFVGNELREYIPAYKLSQMARLVRANIPVPQTLYLPRDRYAAKFSMVREELKTPFIFKAIDGATGNYNYLIHNKAELDRALADNPDRHFIAQRFIPNDSDLRVIIVEGRIRLVIERKRAGNDTHLNNTSKGATARLLTPDMLTKQHQTIVLAAANVMKRDVAGVDLMLDSETGEPYVLEVNASPQIGSGAYEEEKLAVYTSYFMEKVRGA
jgi:glutathione synthase/RimK-type ligase-like ATP-grasp enzyme